MISIESGDNAMLRADITELQRRQAFLESEISEALCRLRNDDPIVTDLRSRVLFVREEIERLRESNSFMALRLFSLSY